MSYTFRVARQMFNYNMNKGAVSEAIGTTARTLTKNLADEGTSYSEILRKVRARMLNSLIDEGKSLECITHELGYKSTNNLHWFVRNLHGMTYVEYLSFRRIGFKLEGLELIGGRV